MPRQGHFTLLPYTTLFRSNVLAISDELEAFSPGLAQRERWLVLNKLDLISEEEREERCQQVIDKLGWEGPVYKIMRSEEHTSELQSRPHLVCRLLLEKKNE